MPRASLGWLRNWPLKLLALFLALVLWSRVKADRTARHERSAADPPMPVLDMGSRAPADTSSAAADSQLAPPQSVLP